MAPSGWFEYSDAVDYCGPEHEWYSKYLSRYIFGVDLNRVYWAHDNRYRLGETEEDRQFADEQMRRDQSKAIKRAYGWWNPLRYPALLQARRRYQAVKYFGKKAFNKKTGGIPLHSLRMNVSASLEKRMKDGKEWLVGPVVLITVGVHNGLYYPAEELAKFPQAWNGRPVPVFHTYDESGNPTTANDPELLERQSIGQIFNVAYKSQKLQGELWIDPEKAAKVYSDIIPMLENNQMLEVSTGLFLEEIDEEGEWEGEEYRAIAVNYRPDHLALLPGLEGACSIADGAGFPRFNTKKFVVLSGEEIPQEMQEELSINELMSHEAIREVLYEAIRSVENALGSDNGIWVWIRDVFDRYVIYEKEETGQNPLTRLYRRAYVINDDDGKVFVGDPVEVKVVTKYEDVEPPVTNNKGESEMDDKIQALITNEATDFTEQDKEWLKGLSEDHLDRIIANIKQQEEPAKEEPKTEQKEEPKEAPVANAAIPFSLEDISKLIDDKLTANKAETEKAPLVAELVANERCPLSKESLSKLSVEELKAMADSYEEDATFFGGRSMAVNEEADEEDDAPVTPQLFANETAE
jgi:hypothetical protein